MVRLSRARFDAFRTFADLRKRDGDKRIRRKDQDASDSGPGYQDDDVDHTQPPEDQELVKEIRAATRDKRSRQVRTRLRSLIEPLPPPKIQHVEVLELQSEEHDVPVFAEATVPPPAATTAPALIAAGQEPPTRAAEPSAPLPSPVPFEVRVTQAMDDDRSNADLEHLTRDLVVAVPATPQAAHDTLESDTPAVFLNSPTGSVQYLVLGYDAALEIVTMQNPWDPRRVLRMTSQDLCESFGLGHLPMDIVTLGATK